MKRVLVLAIMGWIGMCLCASAQSPGMINYQGRLVDGTNLVSGDVELQLRLYDAPTVGNLLYVDSNTVTVVDGLYSTYIGDDTVLGSLDDALTNVSVYLEPAVNGTALSPRERLVSVAYALVAGTVGGGTPASIVQSRIYSDYSSSSTANLGYYYLGGTEFSNAITPSRSDSIILISISYFGDATSHDAHARLQYSIDEGPWSDFDLTGFGQEGTMKIGTFSDTDSNSTPNNYSTQVAKAFGTIGTIAFRLYHFNGGTFYHNSSGSTAYESGPSTLILQELSAATSSYVKR